MSTELVSRKVLIVEDEPLLRDLLSTALEGAGYCTFAASSAAEASRMFRLNDPDGALIDIDLGDGPNGLALAARLRRHDPHLPLVFLTGLVDSRLAPGPAIPTNAHFVRKTRLNNLEELVSIVDRSMRGSFANQIRHDKSAVNPLASLTQAQIEVLLLIAKGLSNEQIAATRGTTLRAAELLVSRTLRRLDVDYESGNRRVLASRALTDRS